MLQTGKHSLAQSEKEAFLGKCHQPLQNPNKFRKFLTLMFLKMVFQDQTNRKMHCIGFLRGQKDNATPLLLLSSSPRGGRGKTDQSIVFFVFLFSSSGEESLCKHPLSAETVCIHVVTLQCTSGMPTDTHRKRAYPWLTQCMPILFPRCCHRLGGLRTDGNRVPIAQHKASFNP